MICLTYGIQTLGKDYYLVKIHDDDTGEDIYSGTAFLCKDGAKAESKKIMRAIDHILKRINATIAVTFEEEMK